MTSIVETAIRSVVTTETGLVLKINRARTEINRPLHFLAGRHEPMMKELTLENLPISDAVPAQLHCASPSRSRDW